MRWWGGNIVIRNNGNVRQRKRFVIKAAGQFRGGEFFYYTLQPESAEIRNNSLTVNLGYNF